MKVIEKAKKIIKTIADDNAEYVTNEAAKKCRRSNKIIYDSKGSIFKPEVYTKVEDSGVNLTLRYL